MTAARSTGLTRISSSTASTLASSSIAKGAIHGNTYVRVLRRQLEAYIAEELGDDYLRSWQAKTELREITREIAQLRKRLNELEARRAQIEDRRSALTATQAPGEFDVDAPDESEAACLQQA